MTVIGTLRFFLTTAGMSDIIILIRFSVLFVFVLTWKMLNLDIMVLVSLLIVYNDIQLQYS